MLLAGGATIYNPATERQETILSTPIEVALGNIARAQMGLTSLTRGKVQPEDLARVQQIGSRIARVSDRQDVVYQFGVLKDKTVNAFSLPGGAVYVNTGLLGKATEDELAVVLAHEVGHVAARHAAKHLQSDLGFALLLEATRAAGAGGEAAQIANSLYGLLQSGYSRRDELEADRLAIKYSARAGYDPWAIVSFFEKMLAEEKESGVGRAVVWQSTHPLTSDRIAAAKKILLTVEGQMFCPECGRRYPETTRFCPRDGTALKIITRRPGNP